jgi:PhnB protein
MKITPYIRFNNNCLEAMNFYKECLGGSLHIEIVKDTPMKEMFPQQLQESVIHAQLEAGELVLLESDMPGDDPQGFTVTLMLICNTKADMYDKFEKLSAGGKVVHEAETFYAGTMGSLIDKFDVRWGIYTAEK